MDGLQIITNNVPRDLLYFWDLTKAERDAFEGDEADSEDTFFRYRGNVYSLSEFMSFHGMGKSRVMFGEWDGYASDSFFSGVLIRLTDDCESVIVGRYMS